MKNLSYAYGIILCIAVGALALFLATYIPLGPVVISIILGIILGNSVQINAKIKQGVNFSEKHILSLAIALMGINLNFMILEKIGLKAVILVISAMLVTIFSGVFLGKLFKFDKKFALLLGIGNAVCGSSAIAATEKIIDANEEEVGLSIAIVNFLGTIGIFLMPLIGKYILQISGDHSGILIGNTLQAVGQVVAAGFSVSDSAGQIATIIKMTRVLMLFPLVFILIYLFSSQNKAKIQNGKFKKPVIPAFIIGFILFSLIASFNILSPVQVKIIAKLSHYLLVIAMVAIGLKIKFQNILQDGKSALIIGALIFLIQIIYSSSMIFLFYGRG